MNAAFLPKLPPSGAGQPVRIGFSPPAESAPQLIVRGLDLFLKHRVRFGMGCETGPATMREKLLGQLDQTESLPPMGERKLPKPAGPPAPWPSLKLPPLPIEPAKFKKRNQLAYA